MRIEQETLTPGTHVRVLTKEQVDGQDLCGTILSAAPNARETYIVEYHPGLDNGHHSRDELEVIAELPCTRH
jgi:hypothetical protein